MPERGPIVLATDFGTADGFVGVMKGVILSINPAARIVDLTHEIAPQNVRDAAFVLWSAYRYFPPTSIIVGVVDPGVGGDRRGVAVQTPRGIFVGPDNGIFSELLALPAAKVRHIANTKLFLPNVSATFHGRDIFAPVAAHLAAGVAASRVGPLIAAALTLPSPVAVRTSERT